MNTPLTRLPSSSQTPQSYQPTAGASLPASVVQNGLQQQQQPLMQQPSVQQLQKSYEQPLTRTIASLLIMDEKHVYLRETNWGLSLLGGSINYNHGVVEGLRKTVSAEHGINLPAKLALNGIYQHGFEGKTWRTNINFCVNPRNLEPSSRRQLEHLVQIPVNEVLSGQRLVDIAGSDGHAKKERIVYRTPEIIRAVVDNYQLLEGIPVLKHSFHYTTAREFADSLRRNNMFVGDKYRGKQSEATVVSAVVQNEEGEVLILRVPQGESYADSLPGGKVRPGELLPEALERELALKVEAPIAALGILCVYVNHITDGEYVTNFCMYARAQKSSISLIPGDRAAKKVLSRRWMSVERLQEMHARRSQILRHLRRDANYIVTGLDDELLALAAFEDTEIAMALADRTPDWNARSKRRYLLPIDCVWPVDMPYSARKEKSGTSKNVPKHTTEDTASAQKPQHPASSQATTDQELF